MVDVGSDTTKAGYAGEDTPKSVFLTSVGALEGGPGADGAEAGKRKYFVDDFNFVRAGMEVRSASVSGHLKSGGGTTRGQACRRRGH